MKKAIPAGEKTVDGTGWNMKLDDADFARGFAVSANAFGVAGATPGAITALCAES